MSLLALLVGATALTPAHRARCQEPDPTVVANRIRDTLLAASDADFQKIVTENRALIAAGRYALTWIDEVPPLVRQGDFARATQLAGLALRVGELTGDKRVEAWALFRRGYVESVQGRPQAALESYAKSSVIFAALGDSLVWSYVAQSIGYQNARLKRSEAALNSYRVALELQQRFAGARPTPNLRAAISETLGLIAEVHLDGGRRDSTLSNYRAAISNYSGLSDTTSVIAMASLRRRLAGAYMVLGDTVSGFAQLDTARAISRSVADTEGEVAVLRSEAFHLGIQGRYQEAARAYQQASEILLAAGNLSEAAQSLRNAGYIWWGQGEPRLALDAYERALALYERSRDTAAISDAHSDLAQVYLGIQDPRTAIGHLQKALAIRQQRRDSAAVSKTLSMLGDSYVDATDADSADSYYSQSIVVSKRIGDDEQIAFNTMGRANVMQYLRHNDSAAIRLLNEGLTLSETAKSKAATAYALRRIASFADNRGDYGAALAGYRRSLDLYHDLGYRESEVQALLAIGIVQSEVGQNSAALETLLGARDLAKSAHLRRGLADAYASIGFFNISLGDFAEALHAFETSLEMNAKAGNLWGIADAHYGIGNVYRTDGQFQKALGHYTLADSIYRALGFETARLGPLNNSGNIYFFQADYEHALQKFGEALDIMKRDRVSNSILATVVGNFGEVYYEQKQYDKSRPWLDSAIAVARRVNSVHDLAYNLIIRGKLSLAEGRLDAAKSDLDSALVMEERTGEKESIAVAQSAAGRLDFARHDLPGAQRHLEASVRQFEAIGSMVVRWQPLYTLGLVYRDRGDTAAAIKTLKQAVDIIEKLRANLLGGEDAKKAFVSADAKAQIFESLIALLIERGEVEEALRYLERSNNDEIRAKYKGVMTAFADTANAQAMDSVRRLKTQLEAATANVTRARGASHPNADQIRVLEATQAKTASDLRNFVRNVARTQPDLMRQIARTIPEDELDDLLNEVVQSGKSDLSLQRTADKARGLRAKREGFPTDAALVAFMPGERQLYVFVATRDTVLAKVIEVGRDQLAGRVQAFLAAVRSPKDRRARGVDEETRDSSKVDFRPLGESLNSLLLDPIAGFLDGRTRIAFLPSGPLQYLPFQVLGKKGADGRYRFLAEDHTISYVLESATIADTIAVAAIHPHIAAFANADGSLKYAETEVNDIKKVYPDARLFVGADAKRTTAMALPAEFNVLHFATHGTLDYAQPLASFLTLAGSSSDDGRLLLSTIGKMANARKRVMVVLSACNTAVAQEKVAGWPVSPALAFLDNGAKTVIASLWKVDDEATALLMQSFYSNLQTMGRGLALRRAQETLIHDPRYADPYYWGAFVLIGESR